MRPASPLGGYFEPLCQFQKFKHACSENEDKDEAKRVVSNEKMKIASLLIDKNPINENDNAAIMDLFVLEETVVQNYGTSYSPIPALPHPDCSWT